MIEYIQEIQRQFVSVHGFAERLDAPGVPVDVPDGEYPMEIKGKRDNVRIVNGYISCCNFPDAMSRKEAEYVADCDVCGRKTAKPVREGDRCLSCSSGHFHLRAAVAVQRGERDT